MVGCKVDLGGVVLAFVHGVLDFHGDLRRTSLFSENLVDYSHRENDDAQEKHANIMPMCERPQLLLHVQTFMAMS